MNGGEVLVSVFLIGMCLMVAVDAHSGWWSKHYPRMSALLRERPWWAVRPTPAERHRHAVELPKR